MAIEIVADVTALASRATDLICAVAARKHQAVLGLPTGATPIPVYSELGRRVRDGICDLRGVSAFAVDEFLASAESPGTNAAFFETHLRVPLRALHLPEAAPSDPERHIAAFADEVRRAGGLDLCVLGIGTNGHIAFNEPGSERDSRARVVQLTLESRRAHASSFGALDAVPPRGLTLGIADLLESRAILMMASGAHKAEIVARAVESPQSSAVPASWLRDHGDITWLLDEAAAAMLTQH